MVIPLSPAKKRSIQKGRNFVWNAQKQKSFDRLLKNQQKIQFKAREIRVKAQAKDIAKHVLKEMRLDMESERGKNKQALSNATRTRLNRIIISNMPLKKEQKKFVSVVLERDSQIRLLENQIHAGEKLNFKKVINEFRQTLFDYKSLGDSGPRFVPNELIDLLENAVTHEKHLSKITLTPSFFSLARQINMAKLNRHFGQGISIFMSETLNEISKHFN